MTSRTRVFVGGPFTAACAGPGFDRETRSRLELLLEEVESMGLPLFSSHRAEEWGEDLEEPKQLLERDLEELERCSHLVVFLGGVHSFGALVELGYAVRMGRRVLALHTPGHRPHSDFYQGLVASGRIDALEWEDDKTVRSALRQFVTAP